MCNASREQKIDISTTTVTHSILGEVFLFERYYYLLQL